MNYIEKVTIKNIYVFEPIFFFSIEKYSLILEGIFVFLLIKQKFEI